MKRKQPAPWERPDFSKRWGVSPWSVTFDKSLNTTDKHIYNVLASIAFICGGPIVRVSNSEIAKWARVGLRSVVRSTAKLLMLRHIEAVSEVKQGRSTAYKLTSPLFASARVILTAAAGTSDVPRQSIETLRKQFSERRRQAL